MGQLPSSASLSQNQGSGRINTCPLIETVGDFSGEKSNMPSRDRLHRQGSTRGQLFPLLSPDTLHATAKPTTGTLKAFWHWVMQCQNLGELDFSNTLCNSLAPLTSCVASGKILTFSEPQFGLLKPGIISPVTCRVRLNKSTNIGGGFLSTPGMTFNEWLLWFSLLWGSSSGSPSS